MRAVPRLASPAALPAPARSLLDTRPAAKFRAGHLPGAINLMDGGKFETWLGSVVGPKEQFYLLADTQIQLDAVIRKAAKIGYEGHIAGALLAPPTLPATSPALDLAAVHQHPEQFTIVDLRNRPEAAPPLFPGALLIPLPELRERVGEIPADKPVLVHCAGGYRSAAGASIIQAALPGVEVLDLGEAVAEFAAVAA